MTASRRFEGRTALVTGAGGGIGRAIALGLASEGSSVMAVGRRHDALVQTAGLAGPRASTHVCDIGDANAVDSLSNIAFDRFGGLDVLVCNAATGVNSRFHETDVADLDTIIGANIRGTYLCMQMGIRLMLDSGGGAVVVVGSLGALRPAPRASAYGMSKAATHAMARHAAIEYARDGIRVNVVAPGATDTDLLAGAAEDVRASVADAIPDGAIASPEQVAKIVLFLASGESEHVTGQVWGVDGGASVGAPGR
jgi:meso-butanediol dehydrogenase / (S,S)-butanediol dehydrogenase / diacetyl reductase